MKVLHVITGLNVGGAETMLARLLHHERRNAKTRAIVGTLMPPGLMGCRLAAEGIEVHQLGMRGVFSAVPALVRLVRLIKQERPDLIMAWMHHAQLAATLAVSIARLRIPVVWNVRHSLGGYAQEKGLTRLVLKVQARLSHMPAAIIYNSRAAVSQYRARGFVPHHEDVIANGLDLPTLRPDGVRTGRVRHIFGIAQDALLIGLVARYHPMKDVPNLLAAFAHVRDAGIPAHLLLVGDGMERLREDQAQALADLPAGSWTLSGHRSDVGDWLGDLDILALPSAWGEGFPNIVGEAMVRGVLCVGTDVGDTRWIIDGTGRTVPPRDAAALADALIELATMTAEERHVLGRAARHRIETYFALDDIGRRYTDLYEAVAGQFLQQARPASSQRREAA